METEQTRTVIKTKFKHILSKKDHVTIVRDAIERTNKIVENAYLFAKYVILEEFNEGKIISDVFDEKFAKLCFHVLTTSKGIKTQGRQMSEQSSCMLNSLYNRLENLKNNNVKFEDISKVNLSGILHYEASKMATMYSNNVIMRYMSYLKKYVRSKMYSIVLLENNVNSIKELSADERKKLQKHVYVVIEDLKTFNCEDIKCESRFRHIVTDGWGKIFPERQVIHIDQDIETDKTSYLEYMIRMNMYFENNKIKMMSPLCIRSQFFRKHITLDSKCVVDLLVDHNFVKHLKSDLETSTFVVNKKEYDWQLPKLKTKGSLLMSVKELFPKDMKDIFTTKEWKTIGALLKTEIFTRIFKIGVRNTKSPKLVLRDGTFVFNNHIDTDGYAVSVHYCEKSYYGEKYHPKPTKMKDLPYLTSLEKEKLEELQKKEYIVAGDPGKGNIMAFTDGRKVSSATNKTKMLYYTSAQRSQESYSIRNRKKLLKRLNFMDYNGRRYHEIQKNMSMHAKKSCHTSVFLEYIRKRKELSPSFEKIYVSKEHQRMRFRSYCGKASSTDKLMDKIEKYYGNNPLLILGNWGKNPNMKYTSPSPGVGLRRLIKRRFKDTYLIDERLTSTPCPCCEEKRLCHPLKRNNKDIHHLLRCENVNCQSRWWNRDVVGSLNILKVALYFLEKYERHPLFRLKTAS